MKNLQIISAVIHDEYNSEELIRYLRPFVADETALEVSSIEYGFPSIQSDLHSMVNGVEILRWIEKSKDHSVDGIVVNCFDDPAVYPLRELLRIPIVGGYQPSILTAMALSDRVGIITTDKAGILSEERKARLHGYDKRIFKIADINMDVLDLMIDADKLIERLVNICISMYLDDQIGAAVLGCTGMYKIAQDLRVELKKNSCPIQVVEPLQCAVGFVEFIARQGYSNALNVPIDLSTWRRDR